MLYLMSYGLGDSPIRGFTAKGARHGQATQDAEPAVSASLHKARDEGPPEERAQAAHEGWNSPLGRWSVSTP